MEEHRPELQAPPAAAPNYIIVPLLSCQGHAKTVTEAETTIAAHERRPWAATLRFSKLSMM